MAGWASTPGPGMAATWRLEFPQCGWRLSIRGRASAAEDTALSDGLPLRLPSGHSTFKHVACSIDAAVQRRRRCTGGEPHLDVLARPQDTWSWSSGPRSDLPCRRRNGPKSDVRCRLGRMRSPRDGWRPCSLGRPVRLVRTVPLPAPGNRSTGSSSGYGRRNATTLMSAGGVVEFSSEDFALERMIGTYGYLNVSSYAPGMLGSSLADDNAAAGYDLSDVERLGGQVLEEGEVQIKLHAGRIVRGDRRNVRVILKAYPGRRGVGGMRADAMAANELSAHATLQAPTENLSQPHPNICILLGGFQTRTGEQWLVFRDDGTVTASDYAAAAARASADGTAVGEGELWDRFDKSRPIRRRQVFIIKLLRGIIEGLSHMHLRGRLHQSLGPASVVLNMVEERDALFLVPRLRDLAFSVDVSDQAIFRGDVPLDKIWDGGVMSANASKGDPLAEVAEGLWRRAASAGAKMALERKAFGIADDIYAAGLLVAYMAFVPLCEVGSIDGPSLQKLLERTFRLDITAARDYCAADDRWKGAVDFLDLGQGAGWNLLKLMLNPDYRQRPTAEAVLRHPFLTGEALV